MGPALGINYGEAASVREAFVSRIVGVASRMSGELTYQPQGFAGGHMSGRLPGRLFNTAAELQAALAELDREEEASS
jgi:hypothetical protein